MVKIAVLILAPLIIIAVLALWAAVVLITGLELIISAATLWATDGEYDVENQTIKSMKTCFLILFALTLAAVAQAAGPLNPGSNAPPVLSFSWTASPDPTVTGYRFYYGMASGSYSTMQPTTGNVTNITVTGFTRGSQYFAVVVAINQDPVTGSVLESQPSNEITFTIRKPPAPAGQLQPPTFITAQIKAMDQGGAQWVDVGDMPLPVGTSVNSQLRLIIKQGTEFATITPKTAIRLPPLPGTLK